MAAPVEDIFRNAVKSFQAGSLNDAERHLKQLLTQQPRHVPALNILSIVLTRLKNYNEAERYVRSALEIIRIHTLRFIITALF